METPKEDWTHNARSVAVVVVIFLVVRIGVFQPFTIPSASMEPMLRAGDYIVVSKFDYGISHFSIPFSPKLFKGRLFSTAPTRGDVVVFKLPRDVRTDYIKRLIGLPGDRIQVSGGHLYINGVIVPALDEGLTKDQGDLPMTVHQLREVLPNKRSYVTFDGGYTAGDDTEVFIVPEGHFFMMGDNRDDSLDSRWPKERGGVDFVPAENLIGKARFILFSWRPGASVFKPWTWFTKAETPRFFKSIK